jgi:hypothetical protein
MNDATGGGRFETAHLLTRIVSQIRRLSPPSASFAAIYDRVDNDGQRPAPFVSEARISISYELDMSRWVNSAACCRFLDPTQRSGSVR